MRLYQIQAEWRQAQRALRAADLLQAHDLTDDAISRAYYAMMHVAKAALLFQEAIPESHGAVRRLFGQVLIQTGEIEREWGSLLTRAYDRRVVADYGSDIVFDTEAMAQLVHDAHRFVERITGYLTAKDVPLQPGAEDPSA